MGIELVVDARVRLLGRLPGDVRDALEAEFTHANKHRAVMKAMGYGVRGEPETIATWRDDGREFSVPRGGLGRVRAVLRAASVEYRVRDARCRGDAIDPTLIPDPVQEAWPFQREAADTLLQFENSLMRAPTGGGKTQIAVACIARTKVPWLVVVHDGGLYEQWQDRVSTVLGIPRDEIGVIRSGKWKLRPVTVAMLQTLSGPEVLPEEVLSFFGGVVVDEVQRAASETTYRVVDQMPARYRLGISADERRKDGKEFLTRDLFGDVVYDVSRERLVEDKFILDVEVRVVPTDFAAPWYGHPSEGLEFDEHRLLREMTADRERNELLVGLTMREVGAGEQVIVMSRRVEHCQLLCRMLVEQGVRCGFLLGGAPYKLEYQRSVQGLKDGSIRVGVGTYQALGTGIDLPSVAAGVCATPIASNRQFFNQVRGRLTRVSAGKRAARLYNPWDHRVVQGHLDNIRKWNPTVFAEVDGRLVKIDSRRSVRELVALVAGDR